MTAEADERDRPGSSVDSADRERTVVKTYVPRYQRETWRETAESMDMSLSEFVRTMVQAGRRGFEFESESTGDPEGGSTAPNPRGDGLETRLLDVLSVDTYLTWDELVESVVDDFEENLESTLQELRTAGRIEHSPRRGGYALSGGSDE